MLHRRAEPISAHSLSRVRKAHTDRLLRLFRERFGREGTREELIIFRCGFAEGKFHRDP